VVLVEPLATLAAVEDFLWPRLGGSSVMPHLMQHHRNGPGGRGGRYDGGPEDEDDEDDDEDDEDHDEDGEEDDEEDEEDEDEEDEEDEDGDEEECERMRTPDPATSGLNIPRRNNASSSEAGGSTPAGRGIPEPATPPTVNLLPDSPAAGSFGRSPSRFQPGSSASPARGESAPAAAPSPSPAPAPASAPAPPAPAPRPTAAAVLASGGSNRLNFLLNGEPLPHTITVLQAVMLARRESMERASAGAPSPAEDADSSSRSSDGDATGSLWDSVHSLTYSRDATAGAAAAASPGASGTTPNDRSATSGSFQATPVEFGLALQKELMPSDLEKRELGPMIAPLAWMLRPSLPGRATSTSSQVQDVVTLLALLNALNRLGPRFLSKTEAAKPGFVPVAPEEFMSAKLTAKFASQLQDIPALGSGTLPKWCGDLAVLVPFLFPFHARRQYFFCTAFGLSRALHWLQQQRASAEGAAGGGGGGGSRAGGDGRELRLARLQRQKVRVSRNRILECAIKVMELYGSDKNMVLEVEFFNEVGTGTGPTLEFYTLLSRELQQRNLGLWHAGERPADAPLAPAAAEAASESSKSDGAEASAVKELVWAPHGLFPAPLQSDSPVHDKQLQLFWVIGRTVAKSLQDGRLLDLSLSALFYRRILGLPLDLLDVARFDPALGKTLSQLDRAAKARAGADAPVLVDGVPIEELGLVYEVPGFPDYLLPGAADAGGDVTSANLEQYLAEVVDALVGSGIEAQVASFRDGLGAVCSLSMLRVFEAAELETLLCGTPERWDPELLAEVIKFDHGYNATSIHMRNLLEVLSELDAEDQRRFLRFVTGAPRLPPGGLAALTPRLTIVRKQPSGGNDADPTAADGDLPSAMTCASYLKMPPYSSKEIMHERLLFAIREGIGSFDLS